MQLLRYIKHKNTLKCLHCKGLKKFNKNFYNFAQFEVIKCFYMDIEKYKKTINFHAIKYMKIEKGLNYVCK